MAKHQYVMFHTMHHSWLMTRWVMPASFWLQGSRYDHLLQHPASETSDTQAPSEADGAEALEPAPAAGDAAPGQAGGRTAAGSGGGGSAADAAADVHLHLSCQKFVELVRESRIDEAVAFGRKVPSMSSGSFHPAGNHMSAYNPMV